MEPSRCQFGIAVSIEQVNCCGSLASERELKEARRVRYANAIIEIIEGLAFPDIHLELGAVGVVQIQEGSEYTLGSQTTQVLNKRTQLDQLPYGSRVVVRGVPLMLVN